MINLLGNKFSVIGITESWLKNTKDPLIQIKDYSIEGSCRLNKKGGGVSNPIQSTFVKRHQSSCLFRGASQKHWGKPLLLTISVLGSFTCITQHTGPTALRPIRRTK